MNTQVQEVKSPELSAFVFEADSVRVTDLNGDPWFVANDVCAALGIKNARDALARLDEDEKGVAFTDTPGGRQDMNIVSESGLYALTFRSNKPKAKRFRKWVTSVVLPSIRKTGGYGNQSPVADRDGMRAYGGMVKGIVDKRMKPLENQIAMLTAYIESLGITDPEKGSAVEFVTSKQVMTDFGFQPGEIRGRAGHLTHRLRKFSLEHHHPMRLTSEMKRNLFHVDAVRDWIEAGGRNWLTNKLVEVRSKSAGQNVLKLVS